MEVDVPALAATGQRAGGVAGAPADALQRAGRGVLRHRSRAFPAAGLPTIVCGPGSIEQAHKPDEFVAVSQISACVAFMRGLAETLAR